jgi:hypothetical protein
VTTALPDITVGSGTWPWFYDYPTVEGLYHYVFSFDGDAVHAPAETSADVTVERRAVSLGLMCGPTRMAPDMCMPI